MTPVVAPDKCHLSDRGSIPLYSTGRRTSTYMQVRVSELSSNLLETLD